MPNSIANTDPSAVPLKFWLVARAYHSYKGSSEDHWLFATKDLAVNALHTIVRDYVRELYDFDDDDNDDEDMLRFKNLFAQPEKITALCDEFAKAADHEQEIYLEELTVVVA